MPTMPIVTGLEYQDALNQLVAAGVRVLPLSYFQTDPVTISYIRSGIKPGFVTAQNPSNGTIISANSPVALTVSQYPVGVAYPAGGTNT